MTSRLLVAAASLAIASAAETSPATEPAAGEIDRRCVLRVGQHTLSQYLLDKYYDRFVDSRRQRVGRPPSSNEIKAWLEIFLAQQVLIAHADRLGYFQRAEVRHAVGRMERHMLSEPVSSIYRHSAEGTELSASKIQDLHRQSLAITDAIIARFDHRAAMVVHLGGDFFQCPVAEQTRRVLAAKNRDEVQVADGPLSWPYAPFMEIGEIVATIPAGCWIQHDDPEFGHYLVFIRNVYPPAAEPGEPPEHFTHLIRRIEGEVGQTRAGKRLLATASFSFENQAAELGLAYWRQFTPNTGLLPELPDRDLARVRLASYHLAGQTITISLDAYRRMFNELYIRRLPRQAKDFRHDVEKMVLSELNLRAARMDHMDELPRFVEDRRGYAGLQALDLFEREVLASHGSISQSEIAQYYRGHVEEFLRVTRIRGRWLEFPSALGALLWIQRREKQLDPGHDPAVPLVDREVELSLEAPPLGLERSIHTIFSSPMSAKAGPFSCGLVHVVFIRQANLASSPEPFAQSSGVIRQILTRRAWDKRELMLAVEIAPLFKIEDTIDYTRYGMTREQLSLPWPR
jgi:hypothetical protein